MRDGAGSLSRASSSSWRGPLRHPPWRAPTRDVTLRHRSAEGRRLPRADERCAGPRANERRRGRPALCGAIADSSDVVRQAAVAALQKLAKPAGLDCLKARGRRRNERRGEAGDDAGDRGHRRWRGRFALRSAAARRQRQVLRVDCAHRQPDRAPRSRDQPGRRWRDPLQARRASRLPDCSAEESADQARAAMAKRKLTGYPPVDPCRALRLLGRHLRVRVKVAVFTYPGKDLRGEVPAGLTQTGVSAGDKSAEDNLLQMASARRRALRPEFPMIDVHNWPLAPWRAHHDDGEPARVHA